MNISIDQEWIAANYKGICERYKSCWEKLLQIPIYISYKLSLQILSSLSLSLTLLTT